MTAAVERAQVFFELKRSLAAVHRARADLEIVERSDTPPWALATSVDKARATYSSVIHQAVAGYLGSASPVTRFKLAMSRGVIEAFTVAFYVGYNEASGSTQVDPADDRWLTARIAEEQGHVDDLFQALKELRGSIDAEAEALNRANGYAATIDNIYGEGKIRGKRSVMLTYDGTDGRESCPECVRYKGQRHSAGWWADHDLVRRNGNENFGCGRWDPCDHHFYNDRGELYAM